MTRARSVCVRQFVDDHDIRLAREDRIEIHLLQLDLAVVNALSRYHFEIADSREGFLTAVRFNEANDDVHAGAPRDVRIVEHANGFPDSGGHAEVDLQPPASAAIGAGKAQQLIGVGSDRFG